MSYRSFNRRIGVRMNILKFTLSGKTAFFKKPDVNSNYYFTYGHIHKVALLGILGAVMGYGGYNQQVRDNKKVYPEFYEKLKNVKISIVPEQEDLVSNQEKYVPTRNRVQKGYFNKKIQTFNNTVGYANADGNLIVREQWLEEPCWNIYLMLQGVVEEDIANQILSSKTKFIPYLGKNDHMATISKAEIMKLENLTLSHGFRIDSLFIKEGIEAFVDEGSDDFLFFDRNVESTFKYEERLPIALEESTNQYITKPFVYTNGKVIVKSAETEAFVIGCCKKKIIQFY